MYDLLKNLKLREILNLSITILLMLIALNYIIGFNPKTYIDEIMSILYVGIMFWLQNVLYHRIIAPMERMIDVSRAIIDGNEGSLYYYRDEGNNELGELNKDLYKIAQSFQKIRNFAQKLENDEEVDYLTYSEKDNEIIKSLVKAQKQAQNIKQQEIRRSWVSNGLADFVEVLSSDSQDFSVTSDVLIEKLVKYIKANQGGIFILNENSENNKKDTLELMACYAYDKKKYVRKILSTEEGLIGQAFQESQTIYIDNIPEDYIAIKSGLGTATPNYLLLVPLKNEKKSQGVIELAMFSPLENYQIEFIEKIAETLATTIVSAKINSQTKKLLDESQKQRKVLQAQETELVETVEKLQATQEQVAHKQKIAEKQKKELENELKSMHQKYDKINRDVFNLQQSELWLDNLLSNSLDLQIILNKTQNIILFNQYSINNFWGQVTNPVKYLVIGKILGTQIRQFFAIGIEKALSNQTNVYETLLKNAENEENKYFIFHFIPLKQENQVIGVLINGKDITEKEQQKLENKSILQKLETIEEESKTYKTELDRLKQIYKLK
ncbi:MAG: hypothetical protein EAZ85_15120 [Bacteroidetes bacterium]|nr:MAG: hypothetical protein EAZ85_15120 [Bacteroidota bacterium]TAG88911.1 MAG: hypothetical protein EAZ20_07585 [Bacteroidota bacterium]